MEDENSKRVWRKEGGWIMTYMKYNDDPTKIEYSLPTKKKAKELSEKWNKLDEKKEKKNVKYRRSLLELLREEYEN